MDENHQYQILLKKEGLLIELSSDDVYFISRQMDKWCKILLDDSYVPVSISPVRSQAVAQAPVETVSVQPVQTPVQNVVQTAPPVQTVENVSKPVENFVEAKPETQPQPVLSAVAPPVQNPVENSVQMRLPPVEIETPPPPPRIIQPEFAPEYAEAALQAAMPPAVAKDDFEAVMDSLMEDLGTPVPPGGLPEGWGQEPARSAVAVSDVPNGKPKANLNLIESLSDLCDKAHATTADDFLLLSAYYLTYFEAEEKFSLKRVNSLMVKSGLTPVNHSALEAAVERGHLAMVPDLTGMAEVTEYEMTPEGRAATDRLL